MLLLCSLCYVKRQREKRDRRDGGRGMIEGVSSPSENPSTPYNRSPTFRPRPRKLRRSSSFLWSRWLLLYRVTRTCCRRNNELAPRGVRQLTVILIRDDPNCLNAKRHNTCPLPGLLICAIRAMPPFLAWNARRSVQSQELQTLCDEIKYFLYHRFHRVVSLASTYDMHCYIKKKKNRRIFNKPHFYENSFLADLVVFTISIEIEL